MNFGGKKKVNEVMDTLIMLITVIISECIHVLKHHVVYLKYIQFLFVSYAPIKLEKKLIALKHIL
jgi:hypothetical protein